MIQPLRTIHRRAWVVLAVLLAALLTAALALRHAPALPPERPAEVRR